MRDQAHLLLAVGVQLTSVFQTRVHVHLQAPCLRLAALLAKLQLGKTKPKHVEQRQSSAPSPFVKLFQNAQVAVRQAHKQLVQLE